MTSALTLPAATVAVDGAAPRGLALGATIVALVLCLLMACWLWVLRDHRLQFTTRQLVLQTAALSEHARVVFDAVDMSLQATVNDLRDGRIEPATAHANLRMRASDDLYVRDLDLASADGSVLASSSADPRSLHKATAIADETSALRIVAWPSSASRGADDAFELARAVPGAPDGVAQVVAVVDQQFIARFFTRIAIALDARFGLFSPDGTRLAGDLDLAALDHTGEGGATALHRLLKPQAPIAQGDLFVTAHRLKDLPLVAVSSRERRAVLAPWFEYLASAIVITTLALGLLAVVVRRLQHEMQERVLAQSALARRAEQTRRLEALGRLSGGIAHDFNNVLAAILGYADLLEQQVPTGTPAARSAEQVLRAGERGKRLVARILSFSRGGTRAQVPVNVQDVVADVLDLLAATAPATIRIERVFDAPDAIVLGDATQLLEAVHNLCTNALHAMPHGGALRVALSTRFAGHAMTLSHGRVEPGAQVVIEVADSGVGMSVEALDHLFEPFFTTRAAEGGTGLGLAMVLAAVNDTRGAIDVRSMPRQGTHFTLYLPRAEGVVHDVPTATAATAPLDMCDTDRPTRGAGQVVMVVDDEPALVTLIEESLAAMGYEPAAFSDPRLALAALRTTPDRFEALFVDQVMPGIAGTELAEHFRALRPDAPILLVSGFGGANLEERARAAGVSVLLQKPLRRGELGEQLARMFGRG